MKEIRRETRVLVFSAIKTSQLDLLPLLYKEYWRTICDNVPPETHFYMLATNSGYSPLHDRFIISDDAGLSLGTSLNGFGNKLTTIKYLDFEEKEKVEREIINPLTIPPTTYKDEKIHLKIFSLNT